jgi:predicted CopG family antitoxin
MVNIEISDFVKAKLEAIKQSEGHKSLDSVVRVLLEQRKSGKGK